MIYVLAEGARARARVCVSVHHTTQTDKKKLK